MFIPLRTPGGELIPESGVFLRIQKREEGGVAGGEERSLRNETRRGTNKLSHQEKVFEESGEFGIAVNSVGLYNIHVPINVQYCMQCTCLMEC